MPAFARQANVLHVPQLDAGVRDVFVIAHVKSLAKAKNLRWLVGVEILELETRALSNERMSTGNHLY
jgi:hypothetical protein